MTDTTSDERTGALRVWHIPQVPGKPFHVSVKSVEEGIKLVNVLADYDAFQYEENIKPDYANASGIERYGDYGEAEWSDVDLEDWYDDADTTEPTEETTP